MYQLNPASLDSTKDPLIQNKKNTKTFKNRKQVNFYQPELEENTENNKTKLTNINNLLSKLHDTNEDDDDDNYNFKDQYNNKMNDVVSTNSDIINSELEKLNSNSENNLTAKTYLNSNINSKYSNLTDSYKSNFEYLNNLNQSQGFNTNTNTDNISYDNNQLLSKLDYIIHLLEEQHNEKTNHITEELILYLFLGIFIIFVLDSFAKASKYIR
tara:strand:- start:345 stop:983 length:639 start_codon:yes stop_codon:yes gene_type:complete